MIVYGKNVLKDIEVTKIKKVFLSEGFHNQEVIDYLRKNKIKYLKTPKQQLDKMANGNHQGIVLEILDYDYYQLEDALEEDFIVVLDHLEDTHNLGAIIRTCEAAGVKSVVIPKDRSASINDVVMKTSVGAIDRVKVIRVSNIAESLKKFQKNNYFIYSAFMDGKDYRTIDYAQKRVLVIGNEGKGISSLVEKITDVKIGIPMKGEVNSLNASVAAGILIFAMLK